MKRFFSWLDRVVTTRWLIVFLVLEVVLLASENGLDFPLSVPFMRRATGRTYLDMCAFCSGAEIRGQLDGFGDIGRRLQLLLLPTIDVAIPVLSCVFGSVALTMLLREREGAWARWIRLLPLAAMVLDFSENAGIFALVTAYPRRLDGVATLTGLLTGVKLCAYLATVVSILVLTAVRVAIPRRTRPR